MQAHIGRQRQYMIGIQTDRTTEASTIFPLCHLDGTRLNEKLEKLNINCGRGVRSGSAGFEVLRKNSEPSIEIYAGSKTIGLFLGAVMGNIATTTDSPEVGANKHAITVAETSNTPKYLTIFEKAGGDKSKIIGAILKSLSLAFSEDDFVKVTASLLGKYPESSTKTFLTTSQQNFTFGHVTVKFASDVAGLTGATPITMKSFDMNIENNSIQDFGGGQDPAEEYHQKFVFNGNFERNLKDGSIKTLFENNTVQAVQIVAEHTENISGTSTKPKLTITLPRVFISERTDSGGLDDLQTESFSFEEASYSDADGATVTAEVINEVTAY